MGLRSKGPAAAGFEIHRCAWGDRSLSASEGNGDGTVPDPGARPVPRLPIPDSRPYLLSQMELLEW